MNIITAKTIRYQRFASLWPTMQAYTMNSEPIIASAGMTKRRMAVSSVALCIHWMKMGIYIA